MSENLETRISSTQAKDAIFKIHSVQSSASEIDGSVNLAHPSLNSFLWQANDKSRNISILVNSDSTGNSTNEWVYLFGQWLAEKYPEYTVRYRIWNDTTNVYDSPISLNAGTGIFFIDIFNFAVSGSRTYRILGKKQAALLDITNTSIYTTSSNVIDLCIINHGHNVGLSIRDYDNSLRHAMFTEELLNIHPFCSIMMIRQNPHRDDLSNKNDIDATVAWAKERGFCVADVWSKFIAKNRVYTLYADNIHPSTGLGDTGTQLFLDAVTEQVKKNFNFNYTSWSSLLNDTMYTLNSNPNLTHSSDNLAPDGYTLVNCTASKDTINFIDTRKGYSTKLVANGGSASYMEYTITGALLEEIKQNQIVLAIRLKSEVEASSTTYCRVGFFDSTLVNNDAVINELSGVWHWRYASFKPSYSATYVKVRVYIDSATTVSAGKTINIDKIFIAKGKLPFGYAL